MRMKKKLSNWLFGLLKDQIQEMINQTLEHQTIKTETNIFKEDSLIGSYVNEFISEKKVDN